MDSCDGCDILGALLLVAHDDGDLDDDDLLVLAAMVEFASARGLLRIDFLSIWATGFTYHPWTMKFVCPVFASPESKSRS